MATSIKQPWYRRQLPDARFYLAQCAVGLAVAFAFGPALDRIGALYYVLLLVEVSLILAGARLAQDRGLSLFWAFLLFIPFTVAQFVWPTEYFHGQMRGLDYRVNRFSGKLEVHSIYGWKTPTAANERLQGFWIPYRSHEFDDKAYESSPLTLPSATVTGHPGVEATCYLVYLYESMTARISIKVASSDTANTPRALPNSNSFDVTFQSADGKFLAEKRIPRAEFHELKRSDGNGYSLECNPTIDIPPQKFIAIARWTVAAERP